MGDYHVQFCERLGVKLPLSTRHKHVSGNYSQIVMFNLNFKIMKVLLKILPVLFLITIFSCSEDESLLESNVNAELSKQAIIDKHLDSKFNLESDVYDEFLNNLIVDEQGQVIGAIYDKIEESLNDKESNEFWGNFGISLRNNRDVNAKSSSLEVSRKDPVIFEGYKPRRGGCKANNRWICVIRNY